MMDAIKIAENAFLSEVVKQHPVFGAGETFKVSYKIF